MKTTLHPPTAQPDAVSRKAPHMPLTKAERDIVWRGTAMGYEAFSQPVAEGPHRASNEGKAEQIEVLKTHLAKQLNEAVTTYQEEQDDFLEEKMG